MTSTLTGLSSEEMRSIVDRTELIEVNPQQKIRLVLSGEVRHLCAIFDWGTTGLPDDYWSARASLRVELSAADRTFLLMLLGRVES